MQLIKDRKYSLSCTVIADFFCTTGSLEFYKKVVFFLRLFKLNPDGTSALNLVRYAYDKNLKISF